MPIEKLYNHARFTFSHMQEFFNPQGWIENVKYKEGVIDNIESSDWQIVVENEATFNDVTRSLGNLILTRNPDVAEEIIANVNLILSKHEDEDLLIRNTLHYIFKFQPKDECNIHDIYDYLYKITSLFSIFMNRPVFPDEIKLYDIDEKEIHLLSHQSLESRTVELARCEPSYHFMPMNRSKVNLSDSLTKWLSIYDNYHVLSTTFQYETNFRTLHSAYSDIILYLANIETIAVDLGTHKLSKYISAIDAYGSTDLIKGLKSVFSKVNSNELGKNLSDLRGELAHEGRPKKLINLLNIEDYVGIGRFLKLIVVSHLLAKLGFDIDTIHSYQDKLIP